MYWRILDKYRKELLKDLVKNIDLEDYYMAGGTALSLQMGLRKSVDFDFFVPHSFDTDDLLEQIQAIYPETRILRHEEKTLDLEINGVQVSYFYYGYNMISEYVSDTALPELCMASPYDIAAMKVSAIGSRGSKKDFFDLYQICTHLDVSAEDLYQMLLSKFGENTNFSYMIMGLSYFDDAENEILPEVYVGYDWDDVKEYFEDYACEMRKVMIHRRNMQRTDDEFGL